ncbi:DUF2589 domain-containing protein [Alteromonas stellipolaris]|uniref:DUF2589 domain-containing protein n=1 Tax=Alteromonas stellipolaris TaxID=233316 RepID=A0AAW7Z085_9ALTE|nr:DUF2589 domain-containing protein [Alteromonas stellipolaris]MDO6533869.1 DUF2589 domain-containing protein [Alteromonas stellipolaris]MDO6537894.1 DUF2589 domain-containing protein [Alteromonas stellipolaris]MDO6576001.1 DUF2589 domain-containing protein [Alteromonas stellipolaris]MDO6626237.1 DUF2589 domain-containing protein [Alteromonas stellipolaris]
MAIDVTPNTVATNALQALDFSSLIGGPMDAIIKAQALAAKTTYEFINEVCLTIDPDTNEKKPVNVVFTYNNNGQEATLTVPLLVILTIPSIEVSEFTIDFIANISAGSSSTEETSSDTELGVDASAEASLGIGPFSIKVKAEANYSSKQHSKAAQESKYSVEYTMNVNVKGGQSGMPTGLQTVLNILQGSATTVGVDEQVLITPANLNIDRTSNGTIQVTMTDTQGRNVKSGKVTITPVGENPFESITLIKGNDQEELQAEVNNLVSGKRLNVTKDLIKAFRRRDTGPETNDADAVTGYTNRKGVVQFLVTLSENAVDSQGKLKIEAMVPIANSDKTEQEIIDYTYTVVTNTDPVVEVEDAPPQGTKTSSKGKAKG